MHEKACLITKVQLSASHQLCSPGPLLQSSRSDSLEYIAKLQWVVLYIYAGCIQAPIGSQSAAHQHAKTGQPVIFTWFRLMHQDRLSSYLVQVDASWQAVNLYWVKMTAHPDVSTHTVILGWWQWWPVMTLCDKKLPCHDAVWSRGLPVMMPCDQADHPSWQRWWLSSWPVRVLQNRGHNLAQKCQKFFLCSLNKYYSTRFTMVH